jgi:hypothetical protein
MVEDHRDAAIGSEGMTGARRAYVVPFLRHLDISVETNGKSAQGTEHAYLSFSVTYTAGPS